MLLIKRKINRLWLKNKTATYSQAFFDDKLSASMQCHHHYYVRNFEKFLTTIAETYLKLEDEKELKPNDKQMLKSYFFWK